MAKLFCLLAFAIAFFLAPSAFALDIYVDNSLAGDCINYSPASQLCSGGGSTAFDSLEDAAAIASAGDTVIIRAGTYDELLRPANSGSDGSPITFKSYQGEDPVITGTAFDARAQSHPDDPNYYYGPIWMEDVSFITLTGLDFSNLEGFGRIVHSHNNVIRDCNFHSSSTNWIIGLHLFESHNNRFENNSIEGTSDNLRIIHSNNTVVQGNWLYMGRHVLLTFKCSSNNIIRNNYFDNQIQKAMEVLDCEQPTMFGHYNIPYYQDTAIVDSAKYNLIEDNTFAYTSEDRLRSGRPAGPFAGIQYAGQEGIIRNNVFYDNMGGAFSFSLYGTEAGYNYGNKLYSNVFFENRFAAVSLGRSTSLTFHRNVIKNNILFGNDFVNWDGVYDQWGWANADGKPFQIWVMTSGQPGYLFEKNNILYSQAGEEDIISHADYYEYGEPANDYSLSWWETNYPALYTANLEIDPGFEDGPGHDFSLQSGSQMIDAGAFLTIVTSPSGSGSQITVEDAGYFFDGFGIEGEEGDLIKLESGDTAQILGINYSTNTITLDRSINWTNNEGISLEYNGSRPDIGAFESELATSCNSNGVRELDEECDGSDFGTYTGSDSGIGMCYAFNNNFNSGSLNCNADCTINTGNCVSYEGFGKITHGGAGGTVYHITSPADSGPGTLREAVDGYGKDNRYIVFDIGGEIHIESDMYIRSPNMTIDGSSAPSPGITLTKPTQTVETFYITGTHDIIVTHMRFQGVMGKEQHVSQNALTIGIDGDSAPDHHAQNIVLDHITTRLGTDSSPDIWGRVSNVTLSNNMFYQNWHPTTVSFSDLTQERQRFSFHHNVYARNHERSPSIRGVTEEFDFVNNVVYNWGYWVGYGYGLRIMGDRGTPDKINIVNNFFDSNASRDSAIRCLVPPYNNVYISGNTIPLESSTACANTSTPFSIDPQYQVTTTPVSGICNSIDDAGTKYKIQEELDLISEIKESMGCGASTCQGTDTSCGTWPACANCNSQDGCSGNSYRDYRCEGSSCAYTFDDCTDCSCSCGGFNTTESIANGNCADGRDNDCDSQPDAADSECTQPPTCGDGAVDAGENCSNCPQDIACTGTQTCCTGICAIPACSADTDCPGGQACTAPGTCTAACTDCNITCTQDTECDDQDAETTDACVNPGTCESLCTNQPLLCGTETCTAGQICCAGTCTNPVCSSTADCGDQDACTTDKCNSPATCNASCSQTQIPKCGWKNMKWTLPTCFPIGALFEVTVNDETGNPIQDAEIQYGTQKNLTDTTGKTELMGEKGQYFINAEKDGYFPLSGKKIATATCNPTYTTTGPTPVGREKINIEIETTPYIDKAFTLTITDTAGSPIQGATVDYGDQTATTNETGQATLQGKKGQYLITATAPQGKNTAKILPKTAVEETGDQNTGGNQTTEQPFALPLELIALVAVIVVGAILLIRARNLRAIE